MDYDLIIHTPDSWSSTKRGNFFEDFVAELLQPMRYEVTARVRFTGMEIDLLAEAVDGPRRLFVECKAHRDPLSSSVITNLLGKVQIRKVDEGWLFSTGGLGKEARGLQHEIQDDPDTNRKFTYYGPDDVIEILIDQDAIVDPSTLVGLIPFEDSGGWTLIIAPESRMWIAELPRSGLPEGYTAFGATSGEPLSENDVVEAVKRAAPRFSELRYFKSGSHASPQHESPEPRAPVAHVIPGDTWEDLRPSRPADFVGRQTLMARTRNFIRDVRLNETPTRTFAVQGPSGWGKSSFIVKLKDLVRNGTISQCSLTAVDTRSATDSSFVAESLRTAFQHAAGNGPVNDRDFTISSLHRPLESEDFQAALSELTDAAWLCILVFDQFEELFSKEELFQTFTAVRELSLAIDANQAPVLLGFSWKTDIALPQEHPAYYLWHELQDRRRSFRIEEFGTGDMKKMIKKGEQALGNELSNPVRTRLIEQSQGLPWLLKKLLVHVLKRITTVESQYQLLERELDVEMLFESDLAELNDRQIQCLEYIAENAPVSVAEAEENFSRQITNSLLDHRLIVRSGLNYSIYWDIFRDYIVEGDVPHIPWARTFQRDPDIAVRALQNLGESGPLSTAELGKTVGLKEHSSFNLMMDLVALQFVDRGEDDRYRLADHISDTEPKTLARHARGQLKRHVIAQRIEKDWDRSKSVSFDEWDEFFADAHPRTDEFSDSTIRYYAANLRRWLVFAGILEQTGWCLRKPSGVGRQLGERGSQRLGSGVYLGTSGISTFERLLELLQGSGEWWDRDDLEEKGLRNAVTDGVVLGLLEADDSGNVRLQEKLVNLSVEELNAWAKERILDQTTIQTVRGAISSGVDNGTALGGLVAGEIGASWSEASKKRYGSGLRRFYQWASADHSDQPEFDFP